MSLRTPIAKALTQPKGARKDAKRQRLVKELIAALLAKEGVGDVEALTQNLYFNPPLHHLGKPWGQKPRYNQRTGDWRRKS